MYYSNFEVQLKQVWGTHSCKGLSLIFKLNPAVSEQVFDALEARL